MHKVGIVGVGHLGEIHLQQWIEIVGKDYIKCFDTDKTKLYTIQSKYDVEVVENFQSLLDTSDIIDIVTPTQFHFEIAKHSMQNNKHVFVEKPVCETLEQLDELMLLAQKHNVKVQVGHIERFNPAYVAIEDELTDPLFFEIHRLAPFNPRGTEVSVILDLMIHDLDIVLHLVKSEVKQVHANGVAVINDTSDIANVRLEFENGAVANLTASRISMKKMRKMRIFNNGRYATIDFLDKKAELYKISNESKVEGLEFENHKGEKKKLLYKNYNINQENALRSELKAFQYCIEINGESKISLVDARKSLIIASIINKKLNES